MKAMGFIAVALFLLSGVAVSSSVAREDTQFLIEPVIQQFQAILPSKVCKELIALGEEEGFAAEYETIDENAEGYNVTSQSIEVFQRDRKCSSII